MKRDVIEQSLRVIAGVGAALFGSLIVAMGALQLQLTASQTTLSEVVIPTQAAVADLSAGLSQLFRRQSEAGSTQTTEQLAPLRDRAALEQSLQSARHALEGLLRQGAARGGDDFPTEALASLGARVDGLLVADGALFDSLQRRHELQAQAEAQLKAIDAERREVMEVSFGAAGRVRLDYILVLRRLAAGLGEGAPLVDDVRKSVFGVERAQLDAMAQVDAAVLRLGVLAGKVGLAADPDALNSLVANELPQTRSAIARALAELAALSSDPVSSARVVDLGARCDALDKHVSGEVDERSLVRLKRRLFEESARAAAIRGEAITSARSLEQVHAALEQYARGLRERAETQARVTVTSARAGTIALSVLGLLVLGFAGWRLKRATVDLRGRNATLRDLSENLEKKVEERTDALRRRELAMQLVLDSTGDGLISARLDGVLLPERSRALTEWFGAHAEGQTVWGLFFADQPRTASVFRLGFEQLVDGLLPFGVCVDQLPRRAKRGGRTFELDLKPVLEGTVLARVLVLVRDISAKLAAEQGELASRELQALVGFLLRDRAGFAQLIDDCEQQLAEAEAGVDEQTARRLLHTVKGNCAVGGFVSVAAAVHAVESAMDDEGRGPTTDELATVRETWGNALARIREYLSGDVRDRIELREEDLAEVEQLIDRRADRDDLLELVQSWRDEPTAAVLARLAAQARRLAPQLGRQVEVRVVPNRLRLPAERWAPFWSASIHVIRNALDHGLEAPAARRAAGKPEVGQLTLSTELRHGALCVVVEDDGAGIDWGAVKEAAHRRQLPTTTMEELTEVLFADGVSSRTTASLVSGRGVGLAAVRAAARALGGDVEVESTRGRGTRFIFTFPSSRPARRAA
jgi:HPt (histidine-containing phosphotransfer) domain-containing protein